MQYAVLGKCRLGATRLGYTSQQLQCQIGRRIRPARLGIARLNTTRLGVDQWITNVRNVQKGSLSIEDTGMGEIPTCSFTIKSSLADQPQDGAPVIIYVGNVHQSLFGGILTNPKETKIGEGMYEYSCTAEGFARYLQNRYANQVYTNMSAGAIIKALLDTYFPSKKLWYGCHIEDGATLSEYPIEYQSILDVCKDLAQRNNFVFYVSPQREVYFQAQTTQIAPWQVTDTEVFTDLQIDPDSSELRNSIIVRFSELEEHEESFKGDSTKKEFLLANTVYEVLELKVNGATVTFGERNKEDNSENNFAVQYTEKYIKNMAYPTLTASDTLYCKYTAKVPACLTVNHAASIAERAQIEGYDGIHEYIITDRDKILSYDDALTRAQAELHQYAYPLISASYNRQEALTTYFNKRLRVGMLQTVTARGRNHTISIAKITLKVAAPAPDKSLIFEQAVSLSPVKKDLTETLTQMYDTTKATETTANEKNYLLTIS